MPSGTMTADPSIPREDPDLLTGELDLLGQYLDYHRATLAMNCARLSETDLKRRAVPTSSLTLLGLVRHLTEMERHYLVHALSGENRGFHYCTDENPEADIEGLDAGMTEDSMRRWHQEQSDADALIAACTDLSAPTATGWNSVRWHLLKVIQEYARHNGHADILRERIDGTTGE